MRWSRAASSTVNASRRLVLSAGSTLAMRGY
jgi:hypothetical protein